MMLTRWSCQKQVVAADVMVMPRGRAYGQGRPAVRPELDPSLAGGTADAPRPYLHERLHLVERRLEDTEGILLGAIADDGEGVIEGAFGEALLAVHQQRVDELAHRSIVVLGVGQDVPTLDLTFPWHGGSVHPRPGTGAASLRCRPEDRRPHFGLFAPYFERP